MLAGYVSDENYLALSDVTLVFENDRESVDARSRADGSVWVDLAPDSYLVTLSRDGFGSKRARVGIRENCPHHFRLLSDCLLGYAWPKWVRAGEKSEFRVHSPEAYKLGLWHYRFEKEFVRNLGWYDDHGPRATVQITPDGDYVASGIQWNKEGYRLQWHGQHVEAPSKSGLYYFHIKTASGDFFSFPWIVEPALPQARIAVLTSNITWNAYNNFGGRSNYVNQDGLPPRPTVHARQDLKRFTEPDCWPYKESSAPISFDRPEVFNSIAENTKITDPIEGRLACAMAPAEWHLLGWLERERFDFDLYSETSLHFDKLPLDLYTVLVLNTHPEYWSKEMYLRVKDWVFNRGGRLMYLGGCGLHAEVQFQDEYTMFCRREGHADLRQESEAKLLGVAYSHSGFQSAAPYRVLDDSHWVYEGTALRKDDLFGHRSLHERCPGGASGHELDKLGPDSPSNVRHLAKGINPNGAGADMVIFQTSGGGAVFSVGSLCWTPSIVVDEGVSAITRNVLRKFSA
jgi:hypothetical protein